MLFYQEKSMTIKISIILKNILNDIDFIQKNYTFDLIENFINKNNPTTVGIRILINQIIKDAYIIPAIFEENNPIIPIDTLDLIGGSERVKLGIKFIIKYVTKIDA